jgi:hypothetical protein
MLERRTFIILGALLAVYFLLAAAAYVGPIALGEYSAVVVMPVILSLYLFNRLGVAWVAAWALARLLARRQR